MIIAHRDFDNDGNILEQSLKEHLLATGNMAANIGKPVGLSSFMRLAGYLHDVGKADRLFQDYIRNNIRYQVNHSSAGGRIFDDMIQTDLGLSNLLQSNLIFKYFRELFMYIILAHHGLYDIIPYGGSENKTYQRLHYDDQEDYHYKEDVVPFVNAMNNELAEQGDETLHSLIKQAYFEFEVIYNRIKAMADKNPDKIKGKEEKMYYISCLTRLSLSILKEADIYDSVNAFRISKQKRWKKDEINTIWMEASDRVEELYRIYESNNISELNYLRNKMAASAKDAAMLSMNGIFKLELPTGAGKTKTSLRYALINAKQYERDRVFYITAFLSVLEQNAKDIRDIIKMDEIVLEHHSNVVNDDCYSDIETNEDSEDYSNKTYIKDSWESPIILTTMVQFCNTLFKEKASNLRRLCKLINSVLIIDEIQSLPLKVLSNFNLMMNFMKEIMQCNIVHCTATQPTLNSQAMFFPVYYGDENDKQDRIVSLDKIEMNCFERVRFFNLTGRNAEIVLTTKEVTEYIQEELKLYDSCLVVLNTKSSVQKLYDYLEDNMTDIEVIYLTTNLCAAHRLDIISDLKAKLLQNRNENKHHKIICISSQLIEAGVDLDFDVVFRSLAGIDSIIQCAGRCNREGKLQLYGMKAYGKVYIIRYAEESLKNLPDIRASADASEYAIRFINRNEIKKDNEITIQELQKPYFDKYYISNRGKLDYPDPKRSSSMVEELGINKEGRTSYNMSTHSDVKPVMYQAFRTAAENFQLIEQETTGVIVSYHNKELLEELEVAMNRKDYAEVKNLLQKLQRYTINIRLSKKLEGYIVENKEYGVYFLPEEYYNGKKGINTEVFADLIL